MAVTYPRDIPDETSIKECRFFPRAAVGIFASPYTFESQAQAHAGQIWGGFVRTVPLDADKAALWSGWITSLNGREKTFYIGDMGQQTARGEAGGTPLVIGASQTGATLDIDGATASQTGWLKTGDSFSLGTGLTKRLYKLIEDADTDGGGAVTLSFWPNLRSSPGDNDAVTVLNPRGTFRLIENSDGWEKLDDHFTRLEFEFIEAL